MCLWNYHKKICFGFISPEKDLFWLYLARKRFVLKHWRVDIEWLKHRELIWKDKEQEFYLLEAQYSKIQCSLFKISVDKGSFECFFCNVNLVGGFSSSQFYNLPLCCTYVHQTAFVFFVTILWCLCWLVQNVQKNFSIFFFKCSKVPLQNVQNTFLVKFVFYKILVGFFFYKSLQNVQKTLIVSLRWFLTSSSRVKMQRNAKKTPAAPRKCLKNVRINGTEGTTWKESETFVDKGTK